MVLDVLSAVQPSQRNLNYGKKLGYDYSDNYLHPLHMLYSL